MKIKICNNENGRSMVEMLGVLAIIGVLSVGAISGYSTAMNKYKLNKQTEQYNTVISAIIKYYYNLTDFDISAIKSSYGIALIPYLKVLGEIPTEMLKRNSQTSINDVYNNSIEIYQHNTGYTGMLINLRNSSHSIETCKNLTQIAIPFSDVLYSLMFRVNANASYTSFYGKECKAPSKCLKDAKLSDIHDLCSRCQESTSVCTFLLMFK